jgi:hypothetical protein
MDETKQQESSIKSGARLHYGPELLRLIESVDFRSHFEIEGWPIATKRLEPFSVSNTILANMVSTG